jgi:hypothetical protein
MKPINSESVRGLWGACATDDLENFKTEGCGCYTFHRSCVVAVDWTFGSLRGELLVLRKNAKERIALLDEAAGRLPPGAHLDAAMPSPVLATWEAGNVV